MTTSAPLWESEASKTTLTGEKRGAEGIFLFPVIL